MEELNIGDNVVEEQDITVDNILADVAKVQEVLQSHSAGHRIDINEIYEKLEELMYLKQEERIEYVATQLLHKSGIIVETSVVPEECVFRFFQKNKECSDQVVPNGGEFLISNNTRTHVFVANGEATNGANGAAAQTFPNVSCVNVVTNAENEPDGEIYRLEGASGTCYEVTEKLAEEAGCIYSMFPQSDFAQIYAFLEAYKDEDRRMEIVTEELLLSKNADKTNEVKQNNTSMLSVDDNQPCQALNTDCNFQVNEMFQKVPADITNDANSQKQTLGGRPDDALEQAGCSGDCNAGDTNVNIEQKDVGEEFLSYQTLVREAEFIHDILPGFQYEQVLACLDVNKDIDNRIEIVTDELLKMNMEKAESELKEKSAKMADELQSIPANSNDMNLTGQQSEEGNNADFIQINCTVQESCEESAHLIDFSSDVPEAESSIKNEDLIDLTCTAIKKEGDDSFDNCLIIIEDDGQTAKNLSIQCVSPEVESTDEHCLSFDMITVEEAQNLPDALPLTVNTGTLINVDADNMENQSHACKGAAVETQNSIETSAVPNAAEQLNELDFVIIEDCDVERSDVSDKSSEGQNLRRLHEIFPDADVNYLTSLSIQSQSMDDMVNEVLKHEDRVIPEAGVSQGCRKKTITYEEFLSALPDVDPVFLAEIWQRIGNDYTAVKKFIAEQQEEASGDRQYHTLLSLLPRADPAFLREKCHVIGDNEAALQEFIEEQLQDGSQEQYNTLLAMFPEADSTYLRQKCIEIGNDETAMRAFIVEQLKNNEGDDMYQTLLAMFPDADPEYLRRNIERIGDDEDAMRVLITEQLEEMEGVKFQTLLAVLPDADPEYLQEMLNKLGSNEEGIKVFLMEAIENRDYPTREDYLKRQEMSALKRKYRDDFSIEDFLEAIPDPLKYFTKKNKSNNSSKVVQQHANCYLQARYRTVPQDQLTAAFQNNSFNLMLTCRELDAHHEPDLHCELITCMQTDIKDIPVPFLQEVAYIENEQKIKDFLTMKEQRKKEAFEWAKLNGELLECGCCYDAEVMAEDMAACTEGHLFCKECVKKSAEVMIGNGKNSFPCLTTCVAEFSLRVIQSVLKPVVFSRMLQRKQLEEVQAAGIEDLESCPFCDFATIPPADDKVFSCFNPDCMRDSCRKCKRQSHIPLRCDEVETKEVKMRTFIEDRMTDALVRTCWQCKKKFIKEAGCNKMACTCGALMCYICRKPVTDYSHFNGQGGVEFHKCPLYSDIQVIHDVAVQEEGAKAKKEIQEQNPTIELKHDPTQIPNP